MRRWLVLALFFVGSPAPGAEVQRHTQAWPGAKFEEFASRVDQGHARNLLVRKGARLVDDDSTPGGAELLTDGDAGEFGGEGRVFVGERPTVLTYYLGGPKTIYQVAVLSCNVDTRSNQHFEIRLADNSAKPGQMPQFGREADDSSGDKVLGADAGGFVTWFERPGGPLGKADWVQFRVYPTHGAQAGTSADPKAMYGDACLVELEVFGDPSDVVANKAAVVRRETTRKAKQEPAFEQRATWQETLIANREAIFNWEQEQDSLLLPNAPVTLGPWHVLGPIPAGAKLAGEIRGAKEIDLAARYTLEDPKTKTARQLAWQPVDNLPDGQLNDLSKLGGKDDVVFLCRPVAVAAKLNRRQFAVAISADRASALWLPQRQGRPVRTPAVLCQEGQEISAEVGEHQLLLELRADGNGQRRFSFAAQPWTARRGAGDVGARWNRRQRLLMKVAGQCADPLDRVQLGWETQDDFWADKKQNIDEWLPGNAHLFLAGKYRAGLELRLRAIAKEIEETQGIRGMVLPPVRGRIEAWLAKFEEAGLVQLDAKRAGRKAAQEARAEDLTANRRLYYQACGVQEAIALAAQVRSMRLAVEDQRETFGPRYPRAAENLARIGEMEKKVAALWDGLLGTGETTVVGRTILSVTEKATDRVVRPTTEGPTDKIVRPTAEEMGAVNAVIALKTEIDAAASDILLANPVMAFDKLLAVRGGAGFASNWDGPNSLGNELCVVSPVRPGGQATVLHKGRVSDLDLHWDAQRVLFSDGSVLWEIGADGSGLRRVSAQEPPVSHYDGCYLPDGRICCVSNACEQAVPCTGGANVGNLHILDADGKNERRVTFDQDHDWNPTVLHDGRVLYSRWEYTDLPHYFSRILFRMNPDGTGQMEYYGSNSYWPNAMYWPRPIPGHPTMVVCVVSGHHGVSRVGELVLLDPARGRHEADGAVQKLPGYGKRVEPTMLDNLVGDSWPKFAAPWPLAEQGTHAGAGKYFLACVKRDELASWDLCLVDVFDNITPILTGGWMTPIPLVARPRPPVLPSSIDMARKDAVIYLADVYQGEGLRGYPRGSIKALRIGSHEFRYAGNGDTRASSYEGGWDVKKILGTVPVEADGSALFRVPANTPIFVQPLDADGKAQQQMRSWYSAMPGETASCIGCHERQNHGPPSRRTLAAMRKPTEIAPWNGPARGFSFDRDVQPVLDRRCVGCHNGQPVQMAGQDKPAATPLDLRAKRLHPDFDGDYSPAYMDLQRYVRRAGYESDNHMHAPAEFEPDTSHLVQLLKKGHYNVQLSRDEWERLYTWIDFNVPYPCNWRESHRPPKDDQVERRVKYKKLFAGIDDRDEDPLPLPPVAPFEPPAPESRPKPLATMGPLATADAQQLQRSAGLPVEKTLDVAGLPMKLVLVPAGQFVMGDAAGAPDEAAQAVVRIERPFYLGQFEVTNAQYALFDARHDSAFVEGRGKDRINRGTPINGPEQPVVRVSWNEAMAFCRWLSTETRCKATLPTEAQWEWACRAGTTTRFNTGDPGPNLRPFANLADSSIAGWNYGRQEPGYGDGCQFSVSGGRFAPNAWGLHDMHGNVAEWCLSNYRPYPYNTGDGRDDPAQPGMKVVRGGSWNDTFRFSTSASRWRYQAHQPVYNVGFRVLVEAP